MSGGSSPIRVLAVDDHPVVRDGIAGFLAVQPDMTLVAEAANGREAIQQFRTHRPDVTLMDLQMPEMNGLDALIAIRAEFHEAKIIMTNEDNTADVRISNWTLATATKPGARHVYSPSPKSPTAR